MLAYIVAIYENEMEISISHLLSYNMITFTNCNILILVIFITLHFSA